MVSAYRDVKICYREGALVRFVHGISVDDCDPNFVILTLANGDQIRYNKAVIVKIETFGRARP